MSGNFPPLSPYQVQDLATQFIATHWPEHLDQYRRTFPLPPVSADQAHEQGFVCGLLLGLDLIRERLSGEIPTGDRAELLDLLPLGR